MPYDIGNLIGIALFIGLIVALIAWSRRKKS
jgi:hypothetical protein